MLPPAAAGQARTCEDAIVLLVALVILATVAVSAAMVPVGYNVIGPRLERRHRLHNDRMFLDRGSRYHRVNRHLPTNPRCKLCYVPFGGIGRLLGIRPSRKNSNISRIELSLGSFELTGCFIW